MTFIKPKVGLQGRWPKTLALFFVPILVFFVIRQFLIEPFVIPSESMQPNLLVHDHILVKKWNYGLKLPFMDRWGVEFQEPERGDIIVFKYPENPKVYYIKRLIGLPGDHIKVSDMRVWINGELLKLEETDLPSVFKELGQSIKEHSVEFNENANFDNFEEDKEFIVPDKSYFVMGDNRYNSLDSRFWGYVPKKYFLGKAFYIWLSCDETLESAPFICDPSTLRLDRMGNKL